PPSSRPIGGIRMSLTREVTIVPNAAPMITPTARSTTLPRMMNVLNSFSMGWPSYAFVLEELAGAAAGRHLASWRAPLSTRSAPTLQRRCGAAPGPRRLLRLDGARRVRLDGARRARACPRACAARARPARQPGWPPGPLASPPPDESAPRQRARSEDR